MFRISTSNANPFSSQSVGDGFINYIKTHDKPTPALESAIDFVTSTIFLSSFGSGQVIDLVNNLITDYQRHMYSLERIITSLMTSPLFPRISDLITKLPDELAQKIGTVSLNSEPIPGIFPLDNFDDFKGEFESTTEMFDKLAFTLPIVSLSDVFNEKAKDIIDNAQSFSQFLDQFQPFSVSDIADFISNLVSPSSPFFERDSANDRNILSLLRPFKNQSKISVDELISAFDRESFLVHSPTSFQLFITCIKDVTNTRNIPVSPFLGRWEHPLTQLNFLTNIVSTNPIQVNFPKPASIQRLSPVITGDFKNEIWRCPDFLETLSYLYDYNEKGVEQILKDSIEKGPALLLLVIAQNPKISRFATYLTRLLLRSQIQYMAGFAALWAADENFLIELFTALYEEQHTLLGRFLDVIDDLAVFDTFTQKCSLKMSILLNITAFFRRGFNFQAALNKMYSDNKETLDICFNIVENPAEYGFMIDHSERNISKDEVATADLVFFRFVNDIYPSLDNSLQQRVNALFDKCISRSSDLTRFTFIWRKKKEPPQSPKSPTPAKESDCIELATSTDSRSISRYALVVNSLLSDFPKDKSTAQTNGRTLGKLLAKDLLNHQSTTQALKIIDQGLQLRDTSSGFAFAIAALEELKDNFDLFLPFTRHIVSQKQFQRVAPTIHKAALDSINQEELPIKYECEPKRKLVMPPCLERFIYIKVPTDRMIHETLSLRNRSNWDILSLYYLKMEALAGITGDFADNCIEAAIYLIYEMLNDEPNCRTTKTRCTLTRIGRWLGFVTLNKSRPIYHRLLNIPELLLFGYTNSLLCTVLPLVNSIFENASPIFKPPNPWTVSILSILGGIARIPYLINSLYSLITNIYAHFNVTLADIEPYPLRRLKIESVSTSDFFYPPFDFTSSLSLVSAEKLLNGDMVSLLHVVHQHFILTEPMEPMRSVFVREVGFFIYTKVSSIANTASTTAFDLVLKDFARCRDQEAVKRHSKGLLHQFTNALSMMAVSLITDPCDPTTDYIHRTAIRMNTRWIDLVLRQLSYALGNQLLEKKLEPINKIRTEGYWDVKSFPPSIAQKVPLALWPTEITPSSYTRQIDPNSIVPTGIYECYNVDPDIKRSYGGFMVDPLHICATDIYPNELPINNQITSYILSCFVVDPKTGQVTSIRKNRQTFQMPPPISIVASIVYCFPPNSPPNVVQFGVELVNQYFMNFPMKENIQPQIHNLLWRAMPDLTVFAQMVSVGIVAPSFVETLAMNFVDQPVNRNCDFFPLVKVALELLQNKQLYPHSLERLMSFLCTNQSINHELCAPLIRTWQTYQRYEARSTIPKLRHDVLERFFNTFEQSIKNGAQSVQDFLITNQKYFMDNCFWDELITTSFPDGKTKLLKVLFAMINFTTNDPNHTVLQKFLCGIFNTTTNKKISLDYFASVMSSVIIQLRSLIGIAKMFGGFLNDTHPVHYPQFIGAWLYIFPLIIQPLLLGDEQIYAPTSGLIVSMLLILTKFPKDWGNYQKYRKCYKTILRIMLLIVHDCPKFVCGYYFDYVTTIPLHFRKLRNIILSCRVCNDNAIVPIYSKFMTCRCQPYDRILSAGFAPNEIIIEAINEWNKVGPFSLPEIGKFLLYAFEVTVRPDPDENILKYPLWSIIRYILICANSVRNAITVVECLFDHSRYNSRATRFFTSCLFTIFTTLELNWDSITIQDIVFAVMMQRSYKMQPVPYGIRLLRDKLETIEEFQRLYRIFTHENENQTVSTNIQREDQ
ncbi:hypothetical protein TRFO_07403 [Tritrichomonas foetus]|uniref:Uncharacterized protein n=1 Tax=Tritrichomonas foetus TaxID=1144522 RepID=A0A1J4JRT2_9EUKA|nr:hypothetical protein TRFO_07403 [Tritrichomonas foetus]|eukprot:OHT01833.1 hypothetical protein TRFO_07403 [Tritrichomonas foetus]